MEQAYSVVMLGRSETELVALYESIWGKVTQPKTHAGQSVPG